MDTKQLQVWKILEEWSDLPAVLYTLLLKFVGSYGWGNFGRIPYGVTCTCVLNMDINVRRRMVLGNIKRLKLYNVKVDVMRTEGFNEDEFTFKCTIGGIPRTLTPGIMCVHNSLNRIWFITGLFRNMTISDL